MDEYIKHTHNEKTSQLKKEKKRSPMICGDNGEPGMYYTKNHKPGT